uniref:Epoxide hydrolase n=1 Tax=Corethrella appendiculata TaxID=1370023 RepID=U5EUG0_9DIPT
MGVLGKIFFAGIIAAVAYFATRCYHGCGETKLPVFDMNKYWGPSDGKAYKEDTAIRPFKIQYSDEVINKLKARLNDPPTFVPPLEEVGFEYGFNTNKLQDILKYWRTTYLGKWNERQDYLNKFPQFKTQIQGLDIHFIHVKPRVSGNVKVLPLLLLHGWPGSVREFYEIIPKLTTQSADKNFVFEVIAPSLPGYGWSQGSSKKDFGPSEIAIVMKNLMKRVGYEKFYIQGGDWGALIGNILATVFQDDILGFHSNMCGSNRPCGMVKSFIASFFPSYFVDEKFIDFYFPMKQRFIQIIEESGYMHIQATKPDTIGTVLSDTPIGLAAYIIEKFSTWTNPAYRKLNDGGLEKYFTKDALLDNIMIYYLTNSITTSVRIYSEAFTFRHLGLGVDNIPTNVPVACAKFKYELLQQIDWVLKDKFTNLIQSNHFSDGGHFAAMQLPHVLYEDIVEFVKKIEK